LITEALKEFKMTIPLTHDQGLDLPPLSGLGGRFRLCAAAALLSFSALALGGWLAFERPRLGFMGLSLQGLFALVGAAALVMIGVMIWRLGAAMRRDLGGEPALARARLHAIGAGQLAGAEEAPADDSLMQAIDETRAALARLMGALAGSATAIVLEADHIGLACERTASGVVAQRGHIEQVASAMTEMAAAIAEIARTTAQASEAGGAAMREVRDGQHQANQTCEAVKRLAAQMEDAVARIDQARAESQRIASLLHTIEDIADQTNLLALNAAIEAARAGDHGRGFAVVAGEVRKLASHTRAATDESQRMIEALQSRSEEAGAAVQAGGELAGVVVEEAARMLERLGRMVNAVTEIDALSERIAVGAEQQNQVASALDASLSQIAAMAEQTDQAASDMVVANLAINDQSAAQFERIGHFDLGSSGFDFDRAMANHVVWKARLRAQLAGHLRLAAADIPDARQCSLGRWYHGDGGQRYGQLPAMREIDAPHQEFHRQLLRTVQAHEAGKEQEARQAFAAASELSGVIVAKLKAVKAQTGARHEQAV
jgi:methyl-accepting chemotaxis protein